MSITLNGDTGITSAGSVKVDELRDNAGTGAPTFPSGADITGGTVNPDTLQQGGSQAYVRDNILGTVSQSSGVPTGAIIESGSNANGHFIKYADGTMICRGFEIGTGRNESEARNTWINSNQINYPAAFINRNIGCVAEFQGSRGTGDIRQMHIVGWVGGRSSNDARFANNRFQPVMYKPQTAFGMGSFSDGEIRVKYVAIGRWF